MPKVVSVYGDQWDDAEVHDFMSEGEVRAFKMGVDLAQGCYSESEVQILDATELEAYRDDTKNSDTYKIILDLLVKLRE